MRELSIKQADLIRPLGVATRGAVGHYLSGRRDPSPEQLAALAAVLRLSLSDLMDSRAQIAEPLICYEAGTAKTSLSQRQLILLELFGGLTSAQQDEAIRELETQKRRNEAILSELGPRLKRNQG